MTITIEHARYMRDWWQRELNRLEGKDPTRNQDDKQSQAAAARIAKVADNGK